MTVEQAIKKSGTGTFAWRGAIAETQSRLAEGETVLFAMSGTVALSEQAARAAHWQGPHHRLTGVVAATTQRLLFCHKLAGRFLWCALPVAGLQTGPVGGTLAAATLCAHVGDVQICVRAVRPLAEQLAAALCEAGRLHRLSELTSGPG